MVIALLAALAASCDVERCPEGVEVRRTQDTNGDAVAEWIRFDDKRNDGLLVKKSWDDAADGTRDRSVSFDYDNNGWFDDGVDPREIGQWWDFDADGVLDEVFITEYLSDRGPSVEAECWYRNKDQVPGRFWTTGCDGQADWRRSCQYYGGMLVRDEYYGLGNDRPFEVRIYTYDDPSCDVREDIDRSGDGIADKIRCFGYEGSHLVREEVDSDGDGHSDQIRSLSYNGEGCLIREEWDHDADGSTDDLYTYRCNELGDRISTEVDRGNDGVLDQLWTRRDDAAGRPIREESDFNADGKADAIATYRYTCRAP
jgi:hypothetical protein